MSTFAQPRTSVVSGGSSGIGRATCELLRAAGHRLVVFDLDADSAQEAAGPHGLGLAVDVADADDVEAGAARAVQFLGHVDVLINNAGVGGGPTAGRCHETPVEVWDQVQAVNCRGPFLCSRAFIPAMLAQGRGHIITVASANSFVALPGRCAYTASKGAALMLTRSIAVDYAADGIRANAVCPGLVRTPLTSGRIESGVLDPADFAPLGRAAEPEEIAEAIVLLADGKVAYMNGAAWVIDGGWTAV